MENMQQTQPRQGGPGGPGGGTEEALPGPQRPLRESTAAPLGKSCHCSTRSQPRGHAVFLQRPFRVTSGHSKTLVVSGETNFLTSRNRFGQTTLAKSSLLACLLGFSACKGTRFRTEAGFVSSSIFHTAVSQGKTFLTQRRVPCQRNFFRRSPLLVFASPGDKFWIGATSV